MLKVMLEKLGELQHDRPYLLLSLLMIMTIFFAFQIPNISVESDFSKDSPRQLPPYVLTDRIKDEFGGEETVVLLFEVDKTDENKRIDMRDFEFVEFLQDLEDTLITDSRVVGVSSLGSSLDSFPNKAYNSDEKLNQILLDYPGFNGFFSEDYKLSMLTITTSIGASAEDAEPFMAMLDEKIASVGVPGGVKYYMTGSPPFGKVILNTVMNDAIKTIIIASSLIFALLLITEKRLRKAFLVFLPLIFALIWVMGFLAFMEIKLSIVTVSLSSIVLGLGVEFGIFMLSRYEEERFTNKQSQKDAVMHAVANIGAALLSSGTTTFAGFMALTFSITPMMSKLGFSLAMAIVACLFSAIVLMPILIVLFERYEIYSLNKIGDHHIEKRDFFRGFEK